MKIRNHYCRLIWLALCCGGILWSVPKEVQAQSLWSSTAKSTGQRPIEVARFGSGPNNILIVGSLQGNEPESLELLDAACKLASTAPPPEPFTLLFIRTLNPDGLAEHMRTNARGVDLNRNFPSKQFTKIPNQLTGPAPASEAETQYMLRVLEEYRPIRVVHVRSGFNDSPLVLLNDLWMNTSTNPVLPTQVHRGTFDQIYKAGSLEEYASLQMKSGVATLTLAQKGGKGFSATDLLRFVTGNVVSPGQAPSLVERPVTPLMQQQYPAASQAGLTPAAPVSVKEVELLPAPAEYTGTAREERDDPRFFELPAPPH